MQTCVVIPSSFLLFICNDQIIQFLIFLGFLFYYKFAGLLLKHNQLDEALDYLNKILHEKASILRQELHLNAKMMHLLCHYQQQNYEFLDYLIPSIKRLIKKTEESSTSFQFFITQFEKLVKLPENEHAAQFEIIFAELQRLHRDAYEQKSNIYLNLIDWVKLHC